MEPGRRAEALRKVDANHQAWCETPDWRKESGQYAKGLANWLAPTKERWSEPPPDSELIDDGPQYIRAEDFDDGDAEFREKRPG